MKWATFWTAFRWVGTTFLLFGLCLAAVTGDTALAVTLGTLLMLNAIRDATDRIVAGRQSELRIKVARSDLGGPTLHDRIRGVS